MKRTLLTLAIVTAAGAAGAQTATTPPSVGGGAVTTPPVAGPTVNSPSVPSRSVGAGGATVTTPPINPPSARTPGMPPQSVTAPGQANLPATPNAQGSGKARARIEADGYKNVQGLQRNRDGSWSGKAMRGSTMVDVQVDGRGNVISR